MAKSRLREIDDARSLDSANDPAPLEQLVRITLAKDAARPIELKWLIGLGHKQTLTILRAGASVTWPLNKARAEFGPFDMFDLYEKESEMKAREWLREHIASETARYLNRYDYPRTAGEGSKPVMTPTGPHRSPDITITMLNPDGTDRIAYRLHEVYGIGEFEDAEIVANFRNKQTEAELKAGFEAELRARDQVIDEMRAKYAELHGMVKGFVAGQASKPAKAAEKVEA